jgi:hypothetical protein
MGPVPEPEPEVKLSKAERKAMHAETNKQIWAAAYVPLSWTEDITRLTTCQSEAPDRPIFLQARDEVIPLKADFKPTMKVLSRKPPPKVASATAALANTHLDDDEDSEEEDRRRAETEFAERQVRAQREREEKQRKYQEVRERLFGSNANSGGDTTQSRSSSNEGSRNSSRGKGRGRGRPEAETAGEEAPAARPTSARKQLFDPGYTAKPNSTYLQKREGGGSGTHTPTEERPIRAPRGPESTGRGGFGFAPRGNKTGPAV